MQSICTAEKPEDCSLVLASAYTWHPGKTWRHRGSTQILTSNTMLLEDMKEKAKEQPARLRKAEVNEKHNFKMLERSWKDQLKFDNKDKADENATSSHHWKPRH